MERVLYGFCSGERIKFRRDLSRFVYVTIVVVARMTCRSLTARLPDVVLYLRPFLGITLCRLEVMVVEMISFVTLPV